MEIILIIAGVFVGFKILGFIFSMYWKRRRRKKLTKKYGSEEIARKLVNEMFWQGQSAEMLRDSLGYPVDKDRKVMKSKVKEVWKYGRVTKNQFRLKIHLEDNVVVGWDIKK